MLLKALRVQKRRDTLTAMEFIEGRALENKVMRWGQTVNKMTAEEKKVILIDQHLVARASCLLQRLKKSQKTTG